MSAPLSPLPLKAIVKSIGPAADTLILRGRPGPQGQPPRERVLKLGGLNAPRLGNRDREDEPFAYESREYLRLLLVGREISFQVLYTVPNQSTGPNSGPLEFGLVYQSSPNGQTVDVALQLVKAGWAKVREREGGPSANANANGEGAEEESEETKRKNLLKEAQEDAKSQGRGLWNPAGPPARVTDYNMPSDSTEFLTKWKGKLVDAIIENVASGSSLRARLILSPDEHQVVSVQLAGIKCPRASRNPGAADSGADAGEEGGDDARFFTEMRLLQRSVRVALLALAGPNPTPTSFASTSTSDAAPVVATAFTAIVQHPAGSITALLLQAGLGRIVDWHAGILSSSSVASIPGAGMESLRAAEREAKAARRGVWKSLPASASGVGGPVGNGVHGPGRESSKKYDGLVTRIWGPDAVGIRRGKDGEGEEKRIWLSSIRAPRANDPKTAGLNVEARELLRKRLIGRQVHVTIDYIRPAEGDFDEKECATIKLPNGVNPAEVLLERGLAQVQRHKQGDDNRSSEFDKLMAAEQKALEAKKGVHSEKDFPAPKIGDASETSVKANSFIGGFKRNGKTPVVIDFVASGSRFKVFVPKQELKLTLVLSGIRAPRTARNPSEKPEPFGQEAFNFISKKAFQRDAEMEVESTDKSGGFIGALYLNRTENLAVSLVREGLATVNEYAADRLSFYKDLLQAQEEAKAEQKNIWRDHVPEVVVPETNGHSEPAVARQEYLNVMVSDVRGGVQGEGEGTEPFGFAVQILSKDGGIPALEQLMGDFEQHYRTVPVVPSFAPRSKEVVAAKFTADDRWYRARVIKANPQKKLATVVYIDYGNGESISFDRLRPIDPQFSTSKLEPQAHEAKLSFVKLIEKGDYAADSLDRFRSLTEGRPLVANVDHRDAAGQLTLTFYDPSNDRLSSTPQSSINLELVREGLASIDRSSKLRSAYPVMAQKLQEASEEAKRERLGAYIYGDAMDDEEDGPRYGGRARGQ